MLMLYQNALVLFGFLVIYYKTICCEVNLEGGEKGGIISSEKREERERENGLVEKKKARDRQSQKEKMSPTTP